MKANIKVEKEVHVKTLHVKAGVRYWEDATVNGVSDDEGELIPCREDDCWCPIIDIDEAKIINWKKGVKAEIHYKICDEGTYTLKDKDANVLLTKEGYVPDIMSPKDNGYGDYIIMDIDEDGLIANWQPTIDDFMNQED